MILKSYDTEFVLASDTFVEVPVIVKLSTWLFCCANSLDLMRVNWAGGTQCEW